jgi:hypothetical protein
VQVCSSLGDGGSPGTFGNVINFNFSGDGTQNVLRTLDYNNDNNGVRDLCGNVLHRRCSPQQSYYVQPHYQASWPWLV